MLPISRAFHCVEGDAADRRGDSCPIHGDQWRYRLRRWGGWHIGVSVGWGTPEGTARGLVGMFGGGGNLLDAILNGLRR